MGITLVYTTWNRLEYTQRSLPRLLEDSGEEFEVVLWDNGSTDGTQDYLKSVHDPRIGSVELRDKNEGQAAAIHSVWTQSSASFVGKVDNDCLVQPGWTRALRAAHEQYAGFGGIGCWSFLPEDFDPRIASHKIRTFGDHQVVAHPQIGGSAFLLKREDYESFGPAVDVMPSFWLRMACAGRVNGWYYPLIQQEHMDDPRSAHCTLPERAVGEDAPFAFQQRGLATRDAYDAWLRHDAREILTSPADVKYYTGWRGLLRTRRRRLAVRWETVRSHLSRNGSGDATTPDAETEP